MKFRPHRHFPGDLVTVSLPADQSCLPGRRDCMGGPLFSREGCVVAVRATEEGPDFFEYRVEGRRSASQGKPAGIWCAESALLLRLEPSYMSLEERFKDVLPIWVGSDVYGAKGSALGGRPMSRWRVYEMYLELSSLRDVCSICGSGARRLLCSVMQLDGASCPEVRHEMPIARLAASPASAVAQTYNWHPIAAPSVDWAAGASSLPGNA